MLKFILPVALLLSLEAQAQTPADGGPAPTSPTAVPLDGGASLLLASGLALGLKKLRQRRQRSSRA